MNNESKGIHITSPSTTIKVIAPIYHCSALALASRNAWYKFCVIPISWVRVIILCQYSLILSRCNLSAFLCRQSSFLNSLYMFQNAIDLFRIYVLSCQLLVTNRAFSISYFFRIWSISINFIASNSTFCFSSSERISRRNPSLSKVDSWFFLNSDFSESSNCFMYLFSRSMSRYASYSMYSAFTFYFYSFYLYLSKRLNWFLKSRYWSQSLSLSLSRCDRYCSLSSSRSLLSLRYFASHSLNRSSYVIFKL